MTSRFLEFSVQRSRSACQTAVGSEQREAGFQRADLLVCIFVFLLFSVLGVAAFSHGERESRLAKCRNNLRELHQASWAYGMGHDGQTPPVWPSGTSGGAWPWDMSRTTTDELLGLGVRPEQFYCPSLPYYYSPDLYWEFYSSSFRVIGYVFATEGAPRVQPILYYNPRNPSMGGEVQICTNFAMPNPENLAYITDATLSLGSNESNREVNSYTGIIGAFPSLPHRTAHMRGQLPDGANVMMLDGHLEWRGFEDMRVRTTGNSLPTPAFWW